MMSSDLENKVKERIDEIMEYFDFEKVHSVMTMMNWEWRDSGVPSIDELKQTARHYLDTALDNCHRQTYFTGSGGFTVRYDRYYSKEDTHWFRLDLSFEIEDTMVDDGIGYDPEPTKHLIRIKR